MFKLFDIMDIKGKIITADAGFCNEKVCEVIVEKGADFKGESKKFDETYSVRI